MNGNDSKPTSAAPDQQGVGTTGSISEWGCLEALQVIKHLSNHTYLFIYFFNKKIDLICTFA